MHILLTGGLGYIGSHTFLEFYNKGFQPVIVDNLSNCDLSNLHGLEKITKQKIDFHAIDLADTNSLRSLFKAYRFEAIVHFAALKSVPESCSDIARYHSNNISGLMNLLEVANENSVRNFIFSSSCTVYGKPNQIPVDENCPIAQATNPYGTTKMVAELLLQDYARHADFNIVALRYFNPIGCHDSGFIGEKIFRKPMNLLPSIFYVLQGKEQYFTIYGDDYPTVDGTCVRDYIDVQDLAQAHTSAYEFLQKNLSDNDQNIVSNSSQNSPKKLKYEIFNIGIGNGQSVKQITDTVEKVTNSKIPIQIKIRRPGDIPAIFADASRAKQILGREAKINLEQSILNMKKYYLG